MFIVLLRKILVVQILHSLEYYNYTELSPGVFIIDSPVDTTINFNDGSCNTLIIEGCMYDMYQEYNPMANISKPEQCITQHMIWMYGS